MTNNTSRHSQLTNATHPRQARSLSPTVRMSNRTVDVNPRLTRSLSTPNIHFSMNTQDVVPFQTLYANTSQPIQDIIQSHNDIPPRVPARRESLSDKVKTD